MAKTNGINRSEIKGFIVANPELKKSESGKARTTLKIKVVGDQTERLVHVSLYSKLAEWACKETAANGKSFPTVHKGCKVFVVGELSENGVIAHQVEILQMRWENTIATVMDHLTRKGWTLTPPNDGEVSEPEDKDFEDLEKVLEGITLKD